MLSAIRRYRIVMPVQAKNIDHERLLGTRWLANTLPYFNPLSSCVPVMIGSSDHHGTKVQALLDEPGRKT